MAFSIPGIILAKVDFVLSAGAGSLNTFTYPALTPSTRKANSIMLNYSEGAAAALRISVDNTTPVVTADSQQGIDLATERTIFFCGLPPIKAVGAAAATTRIIEVYLMYVSACHT